MTIFFEAFLGAGAAIIIINTVAYVIADYLHRRHTKKLLKQVTAQLNQVRDLYQEQDAIEGEIKLKSDTRH